MKHQIKVRSIEQLIHLAQTKQCVIVQLGWLSDSKKFSAVFVLNWSAGQVHNLMQAGKIIKC